MKNVDGTSVSCAKPPLVPFLLADHFTNLLEAYLRPNDPRPTPDVLREITIYLNNIADRPGGADNAYIEEQARRRLMTRKSAERYLADLAHYLELGLGIDPEETLVAGFVLAARELADAGVSPAKEPTAPPAADPGRPKARWASFGHLFAARFIPEMKKVGYKGRLGKKDAESLTATVGAATISRIFQLDLEAAGFASGMKDRSRRKQDHLTLEQRFPHFGRLRKLFK